MSCLILGTVFDEFSSVQQSVSEKFSVILEKISVYVCSTLKTVLDEFHSISQSVSDEFSLVLENIFDDHFRISSAVFGYRAPISKKNLTNFHEVR